MVSVFVILGNQVCKRRRKDEESIEETELVSLIQRQKKYNYLMNITKVIKYFITKINYVR